MGDNLIARAMFQQSIYYLTFFTIHRSVKSFFIDDVFKKFQISPKTANDNLWSPKLGKYF